MKFTDTRGAISNKYTSELENLFIYSFTFYLFSQKKNEKYSARQIKPGRNV